MNRFFVVALRARIVAAVLAGFFGQFVVIPQTAADEVDSFPPYAPYAVPYAPYAAVAILGVACVQAALVAGWVLLGMARRGEVFSPSAFRWVDVITGASVVATLLALGVAAHLGTAEIPVPDDGSMDVVSGMLASVAGVAVGAAFAMLTVVMRGLLRKATRLQSEMAGVI